MTKRFAITFFIVLGVCLFLVACYFLILILMPGVTIFGLRYIQMNTHAYVSEYSITDQIGTFNGSITIESNEIPIYIVFTEGRNSSDYKYLYSDNFNGFTTSTNQDPSISVTKASNGGAVISVTDYEKFLYESSTSERYINIYIPIVLVATSGTTNLTIISDSSDVTFCFDSSASSDSRTPQFNTISIETNGKVNFECSVVATTYEYKTNSSITISDDSTSGIDATNFYLESTNGKITVLRAVTGDIYATTNNSAIKILSCDNLVVRTNYGSISCSNSKGTIEVTGDADIETTAGSVTIGKISGSGTSKITTSSGDITITKMNDGTVTTSRGAIRINSLSDATVSSNVGKVVIEEVLGSVNVSTNRGYIYLGGTNMTVANCTVCSNLGRVFVYSASGTVNIHTISSNIEFTNTSSSNITINCGGKLTASGLTGKVSISSEENAVLTFNSITDTSTIEMGSSASIVYIYALNNTSSSVQYVLKGASIERYEDMGNENYSKIEEQTGSMSNSLSGSPLLEVTAESSKILLYFAG